MEVYRNEKDLSWRVNYYILIIAVLVVRIVFVQQFFLLLTYRSFQVWLISGWIIIETSNRIYCTSESKFVKNMTTQF